MGGNLLCYAQTPIYLVVFIVVCRALSGYVVGDLVRIAHGLEGEVYSSGDNLGDCVNMLMVHACLLESVLNVEYVDWINRRR